MATEKQIAANRANAQKSTGPRTEAGKSASRLNALTHGLAGREIVIPGEDATAFEEFQGMLFEDLTPVGAIECQKVALIAADGWRLRRAIRWEAALLTHGHYEQEVLERMMVSVPGKEKAQNYADEQLKQLCPAQSPSELSQMKFTGQILKTILGPLTRLATYEGRIARRIKQNMDDLLKLQAARKANEESTPHESDDCEPIINIEANDMLTEPLPGATPETQDGSEQKAGHRGPLP